MTGEAAVLLDLSTFSGAPMPDFDVAVFVAKFPWTTFGASMLLSIVATLLLIPVARRIGWVDKPSQRKAHVGDIPLIGGWSILLVALVM